MSECWTQKAVTFHTLVGILDPFAMYLRMLLLLSFVFACFSTCHSVIHPAAANLTQTLFLHTPATPLHAPRPPTGVLSPVLDDSIRIKLGDIPLEDHSIKGTQDVQYVLALVRQLV